MSEVQSIGNSPVRAAIARAAQRSGVDFDYLMAQARIESSLDPRARAATSSASGLYQFTNGTWLQTLEAHGAEHGLGWASDAIDGGKVRDPAMRSAIMALRFDADASAAMAAELAQDNAAALTPLLGRAPDAAELYLAHFLGAGGASQFISALQSNPDQSAAALMPRAAAANRGIFYNNGSPRSVAGVMELLRGKVNAAMEGTGAPAREDAWATRSSLAHADIPPTAPSTAARPSMADTLRDAFGLAHPEGHANAPGFVRAAYGNLRSLGL